MQLTGIAFCILFEAHHLYSVVFLSHIQLPTDFKKLQQLQVQLFSCIADSNQRAKEPDN
jgi:hypothetical protein